MNTIVLYPSTNKFKSNSYPYLFCITFYELERAIFQIYVTVNIHEENIFQIHTV